MLRTLTVAFLITLCGGLLVIAQTDVSGESSPFLVGTLRGS